MRSSVTLQMKGEIAAPGFKPLIWKLASEAALGGWITDDEGSALMRLEGSMEKIEGFIRSLPSNLFPVYRLKELRIMKQESDRNLDPQSRKGFRILGTPQAFHEIRPDYAPCASCLEEMMNPASRRYCYPFWSCGDCGPSYSAMLRSPFIRKNTFLSSFPPCRICMEEYGNSEDRKHFHSELLACPQCGPRLFLTDRAGGLLDDSNPVCSARKVIASGGILALQSLFGGFHLFLNSSDRAALERLRHLKKIPTRPISLMARNMDVIRKICICSEEEENLLLSPAAPVVILRMKEGVEEFLPTDLICPGSPNLGVSLPPTSLMFLLFEHDSCEGSPKPFDLLASCSSNWDGTTEGVSIDQLFADLSGIADRFLCHDLRIGMECVSSVAAVREGGVQILRRARGYTPLPVNLKVPLRRIAAAFGSDKANSVALGFGYKIIPSQYLGDIRTDTAAERLCHMLEHFTMLFDTVPDVVACDMNMNLLSSRAASRFAEKYSLPLVSVQKHHANALACMAENGLENALAFVFDEGAPGPDGILWGAELLETRISSFRRLATFQPVILPGAENAILRPLRQLAGRMFQAGIPITDSWLEQMHADASELELWKHAFERKSGRFILSHAAARLFDSISAMLGIAPEFCSYPEESSSSLSNAALRCTEKPESIPEELTELFGFRIAEEDSMALIDWAPTFRHFSTHKPFDSSDLPRLAMAFHISLSRAIAEMAEFGAAKSDLRDIVLSGSCFTNGLLSNLVGNTLKGKGFRVHVHHMIPPDDSGISVGQIYHAGLSN